MGILLIGGCANLQENTNIEKDSMMKNSSQVDKEDMVGKEISNGNAVYSGKLLAGTENTPYLEFSKEDYEKALEENKKILLYFYANWCPICRVEQQSTFAAFNELQDSNLIGFRVNYRDSNTDEDEEALAKEFGISYQHTKIILKNGERVLKAPDSWNKERYLEELKKV